MRLPRSRVLYVSAAVLTLLGTSAATAAAVKPHKTQDSGQRNVNNRGTKQQTPDLVRTDSGAIRSRWIALSPEHPQTSQSSLALQPITGRVETKTQMIPFHTIHRTTMHLFKGQYRTVTHGVNGLLQIQTTSVYREGRMLSHRVLREVLKHPVNRIIEVGTRARPRPTPPKERTVGLSGRSSSGVIALKSLTVVATAYVEGGRTAAGVAAVPGVIAVDPRVIALGTKIYIPGVGVVLAEDTGGAIVGNRIDICVATQAEAIAWGVRTIQIYEMK